MDSKRSLQVRRTEDLSSVMYGKVPPQATDVEAIVLGSMLLDVDCHYLVMDLITNPEVFYVEQHRLVFQAMREMWDRDTNIDLVTVTEQLRRMGKLEEAGGAFFVSKLSNAVTRAAHIEDHAKIILEKFTARELIRISTQAAQDAYSDTEDPFDLVTQVELQLAALNGEVIKGEAESIDAILTKNVYDIPEDQMPGIPSGLADLDKATSGSKGGELIITAGRPGSGKTSKVISTAISEAHAGFPVLIFSLEMTKRELVNRMLVQETGIEYQRIEKRNFKNDAEGKAFDSAYKKLKSLKIYIDDTPSPTHTSFRAKAIKYFKLLKIKKIYVDHIAKITVPKVDKFMAAGIVSGMLKNLAKQINIPIEALCQLSRKVEERGGDMRPILSDLRNAGEIEEDADIVFLLYRPEYYMRLFAGKFENVMLPNGTTIRSKNYGEIIIAKHRNGDPVTVPLTFHGPSMTWRAFTGGEIVQGKVAKKSTVGSSGGAQLQMESGQPEDDPPF